MKKITTSDLEFKKHKAFTDSLDNYIKYLVSKGYSDKQILHWVYSMVFDMIILRGKE